MNIVNKSVEELIPYEKNPRKNDNAVDKVAASIKEFGFKIPIVIDSDGVIVAGHTRLKAAKKLNLQEVPCVVADDLDEEQVKAFRLADNKTAEFSDWDLDLLTEELQDISEIDMSEFGFDITEVIDEGLEIIEDEEPEEVETRCKLGDLWKLGGHRLICGDSTDVNVIDRLMDGVKAELLLTDPPYGIDIVQNKQVGGEKIAKCNQYSEIIGDDTTDTARESYDVAIIHTENQIIFGGNYFTDFLKPSRCWVVWDKENTGNFADAELAWTSFDKGVKLYHFLWNGLCREGSREVEGKTRVHPTQKPVGMLANILKDFSEENNSVLDLFGGSGSTLIACEQLNRNCYMCELDPHYCDVIIQRWENLTGKEAELINDER